MVGGGPAGCAAAIVLATGGARVVLFERSAYDGPRIGETLPPDILVPLERLGLWDRFLKAGHLPSPGNIAAWGGPEPYSNDFIVNPYGDGWRVDRNRFDAMLAAGAADAGATVLTGTAVDRCTRVPDGGWLLDAGPMFSVDVVVDATGRSSSFCRFLGARRTVHDRMIALVGVAPSSHPDERALIEATQEGWWYSGRLPDGRLVVAFHTDPAPGLRARWVAHLARAPETRARAGSATHQGMRIVSAKSHRLHPLATDRWLAVGDAATAHDPLTGLGIYWSLESGIAGAEAILQERIPAYERDRAAHFERYLATRVQYYRAEDRWPHARFWMHRHRERDEPARRDPVRTTRGGER